MNLNIKKHSGVYTLRSEQLIHAELNEIWNYFSNPSNLDALTPPDMHFQITSGQPESMYPGQMISYRIKVLPFLKTNWLTEISHVEDHISFIDVQLFGPYKLWHHQHHFRKTEEGILMTDIVTYKIPFGFLGNMGSPFIKKKLLKIFGYRYHYIENRFNEKKKNLN